MEFEEDFEMQCGEVFLTSKGNITFHCTLCENKYEGYQDYSEHITREHYFNSSEKKEINSFSDSEEILLSISKIDECNEEPPKEISSLKREIEDEESVDPVCLPSILFSESNKNTRHECNECEYSSNKKYKLIEHMRHHIDVKAYQCPDCVRSFHNPTDLRRHGWIHRIKRKYSRSKSENSINPSQHFVTTSTARTDKEEQKNKSDQQLTEKPIIIVKTDDQRFKCSKCGYICKDRSNMWGHIKRHSDFRPYQCKLCIKAFYTNAELSAHIRIHTGEKPYLCTECGLAFSTISKLNIHVKNHSNIRDKACSVCDMKFFNSILLRNHMAVHSEERPHECEVCNVRFKRRKALKSHLKLHENKREYQCQLCPSSFNQKPGLLSHLKSKHALIKNTNTESIEIGCLAP